MTTITTNNIPRPIIYGHELTEEERAKFDYLDWNGEDAEGYGYSFFRYKKQVYDLSQFMRVPNKKGWALEHSDDFFKWDGYHSDSFYSGIVVKYTNDCEAVIVGTYFS